MNKQALTEALAMFDFLALLPAARLVERLLPGECGSCKGKGWLSSETELLGYDDPPLDRLCRVCDGSGQVWDEGIVEAVATAISIHSQFSYPEIARAVLSALVELLTEKAER